MSATASVTSADTETVLMLRGQIDALDAAIIGLVTERARVSRRIQNARVSAGGTRVELGRERVVHATYRDGLGPDGPQLADALLTVCRGIK
jgi:chorismate mutase